MAETFAGTVRLIVSGTLQKDIDIGTTTHAINYSASNPLINGTAADQANAVFVDTRTLAASATEDLDLAGVLVNAVGTTMTFTRIKGFIVVAAVGNTNNVLVGGAATNAFINWCGDATDIVKVTPGGIFALTAPNATGFAVTAGTGDILKITNSAAGTAVTYDIILIGTV